MILVSVKFHGIAEVPPAIAVRKKKTAICFNTDGRIDNAALHGYNIFLKIVAVLWGKKKMFSGFAVLERVFCCR